MSDKRPYIPLRVRSEVVRRMLLKKRDWSKDQHERALWVFNHCGSDLARIEIGLSLLELVGAHLDHDPALELRKKRRIKGRLVYSPPANSPAHLVYRAEDDHHQKTFGRKPGASRTVTTKGSDVYLIAKFKRLEGKTKPRRKQKIPSRPFPKRRGL